MIPYTLGNGSVRTDRGVNGYRLLSKLCEDVGDVKADSEPLVPEKGDAQSVSILVARTASAKGLMLLEKSVGSSVSQFLGCDDDEWNVGVDRREYDRLVYAPLLRDFPFAPLVRHRENPPTELS